MLLKALTAHTLLILATALLHPHTAVSQELRGHVKSQLTGQDFESDDLSAVIGDETMHQATADVRFNFEWKEEHHEVMIHQENLAFQGDGFKVLKEEGQSVPGRELPNSFPNDRRRLLDMTVDSVSESEFLLVNRIDRLAYSYVSEQSVTRIGRQALSWGNGLVFNVLDFLNPFSPTAIDKDYKTGDDMLYQQFLFANGSDLQISGVPRRDIDSHDLEGSESTVAAKYNGKASFADLDYNFVAGRHYNDNLYGLGVSRDLWESVIRSDLVLFDQEDGHTDFSFLVNIDRSFSLFDRNIYLLLEYFHSGFGVTDGDYLNGDTALYQRIERGDLYTLGSDYLAYGLQVEVDPRINVFGNIIHNLQDGSAIFQIRPVWEIMQNLELIFGANLPIGPRDTEFGGIRLPNQTFLAGSQQVYGRVAWYW